MTFDEALAEIGVTLDATPEEARRAYLRRLKRRRPEQDPEGFRRLRDAYEMVRATLSHPTIIVGGARIRVPWTQPPSQEPDTPGVLGPPQPDSAPAEIAAEPKPLSPPVRLEEVFRLLSEDKPRAAARLLGDIYEAASVDVSLPVPPARTTIDLLFRLHETNATKAAMRLERRFRRWLRACGHETRTLGESAARWVLVRELGALPITLPTQVRTALVHAGRDGDVALARNELWHLHRLNPIQARADASLLRGRAPMLSASLGSALDPSAASPPQKHQNRIWLALIPAYLVMMALVRVLVDATSSSDLHEQPFSVQTAPEAGQERYAAAAEAVDKLAQHSWNERLDRSLEIRDALRRGDCAFVRANLDAIVDATDPLAVNAVARARAACADGVESPGAKP